MQHRRLAPLACGAVAVVAAIAALLPVLQPAGWSPTILPRIEQGTPMAAVARRHDPGFRLVPAGGYDGQFYWGIAVDPLATGDAHRAFDQASYRYGHPLLGWLGWLLSAGRARAAPGALLAAGIASILAAAVAASLLGRAWGGRGWEGLFVAANPGLIYAAVHGLTEPLSVALLAGGLLAYVRERRVLAAAAFGLLILSKEQFVLVPLAIAAWELARQRGGLRRIAPFVACVAPAAAWWIYARVQLGAWFTTGDNALGVPLSGWKRALADAGTRTYSTDGPRAASAEAELVVLAAVICLLAFAAVLALRFRSIVDPMYLLLLLLAACLAPRATVLLRDALRNVSVLLALVPFVAARRREPT